MANSVGINGHINGINGSTPHLQKITLYDRLWGRKSMKSRRGSNQGEFEFTLDAIIGPETQQEYCIRFP